MSELSRPPRAALFAAGLVTGCAAALPQPEPLVIPSLPEDPCVTVVDAVEHLDTVTPLGFSAVDVLQRLAVTQSSDAVWLPPPRNGVYLLDYGPEHGSGVVQLGVMAARGPLSYVRREPALLAPEGTECAGGVLHIPVDVTVASRAGALDAAFGATLEATAPYRARLRHSFGPDARARGGALFIDVQPLERGQRFDVRALTLAIDVWPGGSRGVLSAEIGSAPLAAAGALGLGESHGVDLMVWPSDAPCEGDAAALPVDARVHGFSAREVLAELTERSPLALTWSDGRETALEMRLEAPLDELCQLDGADALEFDVPLRLRTTDGRVDTSIEVHVTAGDVDGQIGEINVSPASTAEPLPAEGLAARGIRDVDASGYDALLLEIEASVRGPHRSGSLSVRGVDGTAPDGTLLSTALASGRWSS